MPFWTYLLHCKGGVFYTGHTDDLERIGEHKSGLVRGFTHDLHPLELVWTQEFVTRDEAKAAENQLKGWSRRKKLALIRGDWGEISPLAKSNSGPSTSSGQTGGGAESVSVRMHLIEKLRVEATRAFPDEACGLLLGREGRIEQAIPARNVHPTPRTHFEIDPQALIDGHRAARQGGLDVLGYYHSHPTGAAEPSAIDRQMATGDGRVWAIAGKDGVTFWRDDEGGFTALSYIAVEG